jgi:hypothetical protein
MSTRINPARRLGNLSIALFPRFMPAGQAHLDEMNKADREPARHRVLRACRAPTKSTAAVIENPGGSPADPGRPAIR